MLEVGSWNKNKSTSKLQDLRPEKFRFDVNKTWKSASLGAPVLHITGDSLTLCSSLAYELHDLDERPVAVQAGGDLLYAVTVLREYHDPRGGSPLTALALLAAKVL